MVTVQLSKMEFVDCANVSGGVWIVIRLKYIMHALILCFIEGFLNITYSLWWLVRAIV